MATDQFSKYHVAYSDAATHPQHPVTTAGLTANPAKATQSKGIVGWLFKIILYSLATLGLVVTIRYLLGVIQLQPLASNDERVSCNCGNSVAEALLKGCKYDLLASAWLPEACRDEALTDEFNRSGPGPNGTWKYYVDEMGTSSLDPAEVELLADSRGQLYWTTFEWHVVHCYFYWLKLHRSRFTGRTVEGRYDNEKHIRHCGKLFLDRDPLNSISTYQAAALHSDILKQPNE